MAGMEGAVIEPECRSHSLASKDGPVLTMMSKRLRALRKKYNRIAQIEENKAQGKAINKEQEEVLKTKIAVAALIDEYEKLRPPLIVAVKEELAEREKDLMAATLQRREEEESVADEKEAESNAASRKEAANVSTDEVRKDVEGQTTAVSNGEADFNEAEAQGPEHSHGKEGICAQKREGETTGTEDSPDGSIADLLKLLYFAQLFDIRSQREAPSFVWTKVHERSSCLSYDFVTEDSTSPLLESDLDALSLFGSLVTTRPPNVTLSHKDALHQCIQHAILWLHNSDRPIYSDLGITYSHLRERLNRILSSEYFTMTPELQTVSQQTAAAAAAATGVGQYASTVLGHDASSGDGGLDTEDASAYYQDEAGAQQQYYKSGEEYVSSAPSQPNNALNLSDTPVAANSTSTFVSQSSSEVVDMPQFGSQDESDQTSANQDAQLESEQELHQEQVIPTMQPAQEQQHLEVQPTRGGVGPRGYQGPKAGGRSMGYAMGGRGRGYVNGRSRGSRGGGYSNGRGGQYYDQGGYYPRNYYGRGGGRGARGGGMMYNGHANGAAAVATTT